MDRFEMGKWGISFAGSAVTFVFGGWPEALAVLFFAVVIDFATGLLVGGKTGTLKSKVSFLGIKRKVLIFIMVALGHMIDKTLGDATNQIAQQLDFGNLQLVKEGHVIRDTIIYFYLFNEWLSITENAARAGLPIPSAVKRMLEVLKPDQGGDSDGGSGKV